MSMRSLIPVPILRILIAAGLAAAGLALTGAPADAPAAAAPAPAAPAAAAPAPAATAAPAPAAASVSAPDPGRFFRLAYCGPARENDPASPLATFPWEEAARGFGMTIVQSTANDYRRFVPSLVRRNPAHRVLYYVHAHGLYPAEDRAGVANMTESNYVHATDPASLRVIPTADGLLVDWERDERLFYDETDAISELRDFDVHGYIVYRAAGDGEFARIWPAVPPVAGSGASADSAAAPPVGVTQHLDRDVVPGTRYRYLVRTIGPVYHEYDFSWVEGAIAGSPPAAPFAHEHQFALQAKVDSALYTGRFRIRVETPGTQAVLRIDMNADRDYDDPGESFPMKPAAENFVEAIVPLDPRAHTDYELMTVFGFAYRIELAGPAGRLVLPAAGAYTTSVNNRVRSAYYGFYLMHMNTPAWLDRIRQEVDLNARRGGMVGGVFLDELVFDPGMGVDAMPVDLDQDAVVRAAAELVRALRNARPDLAIYMNGMGGFTPALIAAGKGIATGSDAAALAPGALAVLDTLAASGLAGGMIEGFALAPWNRVRGGEPGFPSPGEWLAQQVIAREVAARGLEVLCLARPPAAAGERGRLFAFASYLVASGTATRFGYMADRCRAVPLPEWGVDLGAPGALLAAGDGKAYGRAFERGEVWVNPEPTARVSLGARPGMRRLALAAADTTAAGRVGWEPVTGSVELGPHSAVILARDANEGAEP